MKKKSPLFILLLVILLAGCVRVPTGNAREDYTVRVLVFKSVDALSVRGSTEGDLRIKAAGNGVEVNGRNESLPLRLNPAGEFIYLDGRPYRGSIVVSAGEGGLMVVDELALESYLVGVINTEISSRWPVESIKAQAVVARTYAIFNMSKKKDAPYDIEGSVLGQVYSGAAAEDGAALKAVQETEGQILTYGGEPALTVYHSNAGGMTDSAKDVWQGDYPYLQAVESPYDKDAPRYTWSLEVGASELESKLKEAGFKISEPVSINPVSVTRSGRIKALIIKDVRGGRAFLTGEDLRRTLGYSNLRSTRFVVAKKGGTFVFNGRGSGHGVGLSQWGAKGMAEHGYTYRAILEHFYPGTELEKAY